MKVVFMSDSHGYDDRVEKIISDNQDADYFYHLGDICTDYSHNKLNISKESTINCGQFNEKYMLFHRSKLE